MSAPPPSIKQLIISRLLDLCQPLKAEGKFRVIERQSTIFLLAAIKPAIHLVIGDEHVISPAEDVRGYTMEFPAMFKLITADARDPYTLADTSVAYLQEKIETDSQLRGLANHMKYDGELPFTEETLKPEGGTVVLYIIQYRRPRGEPSTAY